MTRLKNFEPPKKRRRNPAVITAAEAAKLMNLSRNAVLWNIRQGNLPAKNDGYRYWIKMSDLRKFRNKFYE
jgi:excisionase family DNA binding protein